VIPEGLATKVGKYGAVLLGIVALVAAVLDGDHTEETIASLVGAVLLAVRMMDGRYKQAAAIYRDAPSPRQLDDFSGEEDHFLEDAPYPGSHAELAELELTPEEQAEIENQAIGGHPDGTEYIPEGAIGDKPGEENV
jgi:hypothetical protein